MHDRKLFREKNALNLFQLNVSDNLRVTWCEPRRLKFWKIIEGGTQDFIINERNKHCFSLIMYGFGNNNALYSAGLSFIMFTFLFITFYTWDCYDFGSNPSLVLLIKVLLMKINLP